MASVWYSSSNCSILPDALLTKLLLEKRLGYLSSGFEATLSLTMLANFSSSAFNSSTDASMSRSSCILDFCCGSKFWSWQPVRVSGSMRHPVYVHHWLEPHVVPKKERKLNTRISATAKEEFPVLMFLPDSLDRLLRCSSRHLLQHSLKSFLRWLGTTKHWEAGHLVFKLSLQRKVLLTAPMRNKK